MSVDSLEVLAAAAVPTVLTLHDYWLFCPRGQMFHADEEACATEGVTGAQDTLTEDAAWELM